ncbi:MAG: hypothetical protein NZ521_11330 [Flammeovirgaceae bacterium]|nr:hypothetical protein [Flammeovirgaceae bacterium]MDW8288315.1 hypothetical protein [Flammeovirgaceae bacterium]
MSYLEENTKFGAFVRNIETKISNLAKLEIKTIVGDYKIDAQDNISQKKDGDFKIMYSQIDLVAGDMTTYISNDLVQDRYAWLREFHARKEEKGHDIIQGNIRAIAALYELYKQTKGLDFKEERMDETERESLA